VERRIVTCDRCGAEIHEDLVRLQEVGERTSNFVDLCKPCLRKFRKWLAEGEPREEGKA
jgi:hypothetical protein